MTATVKAWKVISDYGEFWKAWVEWPEGVDYVHGHFETEQDALRAACDQRELGMPWSAAVVADMWRRANAPSTPNAGTQIGYWR